MTIKVCHLEGQWCAEDGADFRSHPPNEWEWRLLIRVPEFINQYELDCAIQTVLAKMHHLAEEKGLHLRGPHHEIYLSDPNRVPQSRLRTIVRYSVA